MSDRSYWIDYATSYVTQLLKQGKSYSGYAPFDGKWNSNKKTLVDLIAYSKNLHSDMVVTSASTSDVLDTLHGSIAEGQYKSTVDILKAIKWHRR